MNLLMKNKWVQLAVFGIIVFLIGAVASYIITNSQTEESVPVLGDRLILTNPLSTGEGVGGRNDAGAVRDEGASRPVIEIPFTDTVAISEGWEDPFVCDPGRGKTFIHNDPSKPYFLIYSKPIETEDGNKLPGELIGIYLFSFNEVSGAPWKLMEEFRAAGKVRLDKPHWAMLMYFNDATRSCGVTQGGCGHNPYC
jgi:hypothetical protein